MNRFYLTCGLLLVLFAILTLVVGEIPFASVWQGVQERFFGESTRWNPLLDERLPRLIVILCTGASLAVSGAVMQALFQNPLASPSVLGISCGGCLLVIPIFIFQLHTQFPFVVPAAAFSGCLLTLGAVYSLSRVQGQVHVGSLILTGIAVSTLLLAIQGALLYVLRDRWQLIQLVTEWIAGSTADRTWTHVHMQLPLTLLGLAGCWIYRQELNVLSLGDEEACNLGVEVRVVRWRLMLCVALLTGGAIAAVGMVAFYGLVLPHIVRKVWGADCMKLIPFCMLAGATAFVGIDLALRVLGLHTLSIGNVSALLGGCFFLFLLTEKRRVYA